jgi:intracellular multiplication protein IcmP
MAGQQGQGQSESPYGLLWIVLSIFGIGLLVWYIPQVRAVLIFAFFKIKLAEIAIISLFTESLSTLAQQIKNTNPGAVNLLQVGYVANAVGRYLMIPVALLMGIFAFLAYQRNVVSHYRNTFNMQRLLAQEKKNWPQVGPVAKLDLINEDLDSGPWAMAMTPMQFAKKYKLLKFERRATTKTGLSKDVKDVASLIQEKAARIFVRQVGRPWTRVEDLPPHARALFAIFAAKADAQSELADQLIRKIAHSAESGHLDFSGIDELLPSLTQLSLVQKVMDSHAYVLTVMASMLQLARTDGVLASAEFLWLKPLDRTLWYMLNTVGRETVVTEVAGAYAHWLAERAIGRKLMVPMVRQASLALSHAIDEMIYIPDEKT